MAFYKGVFKMYENKKVVILIAVRMKSKRLPGKALKIIEGQTITEHLIDRMKHCKNVDKIIKIQSVIGI